MGCMGLAGRRCLWSQWVFVVVAIAASGATYPAVARCEGASPSAAVLSLKAGDVKGFKPGRPQVFRAAREVEMASGQKPSPSEVERYESEGFVEAAIARLRSDSEPGAAGVASVFAFGTPAAAQAEMKAELGEEIDRSTLREEGVLTYLTLRRFSISGVPGSVAFSFLPNRAAKRKSLESGVAKGFVVLGSCLVTVGVVKPSSDEVVEPVIGGMRAIFGRSGGICPQV